MACVPDGVLRAQLDGELSEEERMEVKKHCEACADCRRRAEAIAHQAERITGILSALSPIGDEASIDARAALAQFRTKQSAIESRGPSFVAALFARRLAPAWATVGALILIGAMLAFSPTRSWAQRLLGMLRVQKITVVPLDFSALNDQSNRNRQGKSIAQLISEDVVVIQKAGDPVPVDSVQEATRMAGFKVRVVGKLGEPTEVRVLGEQALQITIDRDRLQTIFEEAGRSELQLPLDSDGATVLARIPKVVFARYGSCSHIIHGDNTTKPESDNGTCVGLVQALSPTVTVSPELDLAPLAEVALQLAGMSPEAARQFSQSVDWSTTLVVGIPRGTSAEVVEVEGVSGTLLRQPARGDRQPAMQTLLWVKNGVIQALYASGDSVDALTLAESLN